MIVINYNIFCGLNSLHQTVMVNWLNCINIPIEVKRPALEGLSPKTVLVTEDIKMYLRHIPANGRFSVPMECKLALGAAICDNHVFPSICLGSPRTSIFTRYGARSHMTPWAILYILFNISPPARWGLLDFYQSALPPPPPPPPRLAVLFLLVLLLASSSSFSSTMSASTSTCTSALPTLRQALCQLSSPTLCAKLFANFPAQCAPLDLNLGPSQLSVHRWTSTAR